MALVAFPYFLLIANYAQWWGEWCPPARYLAPVLPLLGLPFSLALDAIKSAIFRGIYGVLLVLSFLTTWGFLYQPQWMYNQPNGKSILFTKGLSHLLNRLHMTLFDSSDLVGLFPSFVFPYFAYSHGRDAGDAAAAAAWRASFWPVVIVFLVVLVSLSLAWFERSRSNISPGARLSGSDNLESDYSLKTELK